MGVTRGWLGYRAGSPIPVSSGDAIAQWQWHVVLCQATVTYCRVHHFPASCLVRGLEIYWISFNNIARFKHKHLQRSYKWDVSIPWATEYTSRYISESVMANPANWQTVNLLPRQRRHVLKHQRHEVQQPWFGWLGRLHEMTRGAAEKLFECHQTNVRYDRLIHWLVN